ncbi:hypothetical protein CC78DRAFT_356002 [Lojkania enalia]|uniref:Uncharacterized protein n=1 Tax=Lojkania enalia TaxID=147567 RepID=A0A9P4N763_9PLEO|nr:hypothetical protein CC78DRAFT_356002 [Didymosphaeria enalia]
MTLGNKFQVAALALLPTFVLSAPLGSKHNIYLVHCDPVKCPIGLCYPGEFQITAAAFFANGPINPDSSTNSPTSLGQLSGYQPKWEGIQRRVAVGTMGTFASNFPASASTAEKGSIVGDASLGSEPFVCFKDGATKFTIKYDAADYTCTTDYWCPSVEVGSGKV